VRRRIRHLDCIINIRSMNVSNALTAGDRAT
jgi:hypothetical protein